MEVDDFKTNICFICTSLFPKLHKVDSCSETDNAKCYIVLLKYLLNAGLPDVLNEENSEQQLLTNYILKQLEDNDKNKCAVKYGGIQFCSRCTQLSKDVWSLRRDLEAIQIKLYDKLKVIHQTVELGSKFLNKTDLSSTSTSETRFNEMLLRFQNYVSNSVDWLTRLEPDLWTNEVLTVADILKEEPTDSVINEMEVDDFFDFDLTPDADLSEPVKVENTVTKPKRKLGRPKKSLMPSSFYPLDVSEHADNAHNSSLTLSDPLQMEPIMPPIKRGWGRPKRIIVPSRPPSEDDHEIDANVKQDLTAENKDEDTSTAQSKLKSELELTANSKSSTSRTKRKRKAVRRLYPKRTCPKKYKGPYIKRSDFLKCEPCQFKTVEYSTMEAHLRIQHETPTKSFNCSDCSLGFTTEKLYILHLYYHKYAVKCKICPERVVVLEMKKHLEEIHQKQVFSCPGCSYVFPDFINLIQHKSKKHAGLLLPCMLCPEGTSQDPEICQNRQKLYTHLYHAHNMKHILLKCDEPNCIRTFFDVKSKDKHMLTHSVEIKCSDCDGVFSSNNSLDNHVRFTHKKLYNVHCESCSESFANKVILQRHQIDAHGAPKSQCELCGKELMTKEGLVAHQRKVHGIGLDKHIEKKIDCTICAKSFTTTSLLKRHMYIHSDVKDFACEICGFLTKRQASLKIHMKIHAEIKQHACPHCPKRFAKSDALRQHVRVHTGERPYQCDECGAAFNQRTSMMIHKRKHKPDGSFVPRGPRNNKSKEETKTQPNIHQLEDNLQIPADC